MNPRDRLQALLLPAYAAGVALVAFTTVYLAAHYGAQVSERCQGSTCQLWQVRACLPLFANDPASSSASRGPSALV
jgi:hypothetical protein